MYVPTYLSASPNTPTIITSVSHPDLIIIIKSLPRVGGGQIPALRDPLVCSGHPAAAASSTFKVVTLVRVYLIVVLNLYLGHKFTGHNS